MEIARSEIRESQRLYDAALAAEAVDNGETIQAIEAEILEIHKRREPHVILGHHGEAQRLRNEMDIRRGRITGLHRERSRAIEGASDAFEKHVKAHREQMLGGLRRLTKHLRDARQYVVVQEGAARDEGRSNFRKVQTNLVACLTAERALSQAYSFVATARAPLAELVAAFETAEKAATPQNFPEMKGFLFGDADFARFTLYFDSGHKVVGPSEIPPLDERAITSCIDSVKALIHDSKTFTWKAA